MVLLTILYAVAALFCGVFGYFSISRARSSLLAEHDYANAGVFIVSSCIFILAAVLNALPR